MTLTAIAALMTGLASLVAAGASIWSAWNARKALAEARALSLTVKNLKKRA